LGGKIQVSKSNMTVFIFAGTGDGKKFICSLLLRAEKAGIKMTAHIFCATEYGAELVRTELNKNVGKKNAVVHCGRLGENEISKKINELKPDYVIDCTHPFAEAVTKNIRAVCENTGVPCLRLRRETSEKPPEGLRIHYAGGMKEAASFLKDKTGNIFLTTGSKDIHCFSGEGFEGRVYPRVLPLEESIGLCRKAGISAKNIIAMQGPFSEELNRALIRGISARWLVSKETGAEGGFAAKMNAALAEGCAMLVIRPPEENSRADAETIIDIVIKDTATKNAAGCEKNGKKRYFPAFINITNKKFLIFGAGVIALRRLQTLLRFDCRIEIISKEITPPVKRICSDRVTECRITARQRVYRDGDCAADLVIAATNDRDVNRMIGEECKRKNIPVSVADSREESTFYFPALVDSGGLTIGLTSDGRDHKAVREAAQKIRDLFAERESTGKTW
jgi:precorrin-2 dehydrogenase/sirohydrochlorin ferrochelatase/precorrin-6A/cobalt-precorrin-6A reductase